MKYILLTFVSFVGFSQEVIVSSGNSNKNNDLNIDYSVGQIFLEATPNSDYTGVRVYYKEGVHQAYFVDSGVRQLQFDVATKVFPNPTKDIFNIQLDLDASDFVGLSYSIHSTQGQLITTGQVDSNPVSIDISSLSSGVYFVYLYSNLNETKLIKIIKN